MFYNCFLHIFVCSLLKLKLQILLYSNDKSIDQLVTDQLVTENVSILNHLDNQSFHLSVFSAIIPWFQLLKWNNFIYFLLKYANKRESLGLSWFDKTKKLKALRLALVYY